MGSRSRLALISVVVLLSAAGSSATERARVADASDSARVADAVRVPSTETTIVHAQKRDLPWAAQIDIRERQMLAWIILLMKDGRGAR